MLLLDVSLCLCCSFFIVRRKVQVRKLGWSEKLKDNSGGKLGETEPESVKFKSSKSVFLMTLCVEIVAG